MQNQALKKRLRKFEQAEIMGTPMADTPAVDPLAEGNPKAFSITENLP
jgi:hypothetical protein